MSFIKQYIAFKTIFFNELKRIFRIWPQTILPNLITSFLYFTIFGHLLGRHIGEINNIDYILYLVPGIMMFVVINNSYVNCVSSVYSAKFSRSFEEILLSPANNLVIICGYCLSSAFRGIIIGILVFIIGLLFVEINIQNIMFSIFLLVMTAIIFALIGFINGIFANKFDDTTWVSSFILTPMIYLGGVFYSIENLPEKWQKISLLNPIYYIIAGFKNSMIGSSNISEILVVKILLLLFALLLAANLFILYKGYRIKN